MQRQNGGQGQEILQLEELAEMECVSDNSTEGSINLPMDLLMEEMSQTMIDAFELLDATEKQIPLHHVKNVS